MSVLEFLAACSMLLGALFTLLAAVGVVRMPDVYCRITTTSKAAPFGVALVLAGAALALGDRGFALQSAAVATFVALTSPVAAHALARSAQRAGVPGLHTMPGAGASGARREDERGSPASEPDPKGREPTGPEGP